VSPNSDLLGELEFLVDGQGPDTGDGYAGDTKMTQREKNKKEVG
jgi:hypothetical protein